MVGAGGAGREVAAEAAPDQGDAIGRETVVGGDEVEDGTDHGLEVVAEAEAALVEHLALTGTAEHHDVHPAERRLQTAQAVGLLDRRVVARTGSERSARTGHRRPTGCRRGWTRRSRRGSRRSRPRPGGGGAPCGTSPGSSGTTRAAARPAGRGGRRNRRSGSTRSPAGRRRPRPGWRRRARTARPAAGWTRRRRTTRRASCRGCPARCGGRWRTPHPRRTCGSMPSRTCAAAAGRSRHRRNTASWSSALSARGRRGCWSATSVGSPPVVGGSPPQAAGWMSAGELAGRGRGLIYSGKVLRSTPAPVARSARMLMKSRVSMQTTSPPPPAV